jgi:hypothetical protein
LRQIDDQTRTVAGFDHCRTAGVAAAQIAGLVRQLAGDTRQIQGDSRRRFGGVALGLRWRAVKRQLQLDTVTR